jgi:hypothetical protein
MTIGAVGGIVAAAGMKEDTGGSLNAITRSRRNKVKKRKKKENNRS